MSCSVISDRDLESVERIVLLRRNEKRSVKSLGDFVVDLFISSYCVVESHLHSRTRTHVSVRPFDVRRCTESWRFLAVCPRVSVF